MKADPLGEPRNPLAVYLLVLALVSGTGLLFGVPSSGSIESELPVYLARIWGAMLVFGSGTSLIGLFWQGDVRSGLLMKRVGMLALTVAAFVYAIVIITAAGMNGALVAGIIAGFGLACGLQFIKINKRIRRIIRASK